MGEGLLSALIATSITAWIYAKFMRRTGGLGKESIILAGVVGFFIFIITFFILNLILPE